MLSQLLTFFDHSRHKLWVRDLDAPLDVLTFTGQECLSQPFGYTIEFTSSVQDIVVEQILGQPARFSLYAKPKPPPFVFPGYPVPEIKPLRTLNGVITGFRRLSASKDEARYEVTLEPRLALLSRGQQYRIYQHKSVPQIVEHVLRTRHGFRGQDFFFNVIREYPRRQQVMQYDESDLAFITRLLAEVGIWFRFVSDERLDIDVVEFHDDQRHYQNLRPKLAIPCRPPGGLSNTDEDAVWSLQTQHKVVEKNIAFRAYDPRNITAHLTSEVDQSRGTFSAHGAILSNGATTTYGEAYHYAEHYTVLGDKFDQDEKLESESGYFYARLRHERYLNDQTRLSGTSNSASLALAQVLDIEGAPQAFHRGTVITTLTLTAARDRSLTVEFEAIPFADRICFRPPLQKKPRIAGTLPARVTSNREYDPYSHIDQEGRYKVNFLFDRDSWTIGEESLWLRLARPYAGEKYGLHLPLICGTEVAVAFEQGDPDRPYIAHALHDNQHPDHVTLAREDYRRNVLRTPANNKLRMEDLRGKEHVKLSTEHSGKSQLNLGHLVDSNKKKRGEGFELRTDGWGAIRGGKGIFISAEEQAKAHGKQMDMEEAIVQLESALSLARSMAQAARSAKCTPGDVDSQSRLSDALTNLAQPGLLLHAPSGIGIVSPEAIRLASGQESIGVISAHNTDISAGTTITATAEDAISLCANKADLQFKAAQGNVDLHAQRGKLHALAGTDIKIESIGGRVEISAPEELVLNCGGAYIRIKGGEIEIGAPGNIYLKGAQVEKSGANTVGTPATPIPKGYSAAYNLSDPEGAAPFARYRITTPQGEVFTGVTDKDGKTMPVHTALPGDVVIDYPEAERRIVVSGPVDHNYEGLTCTVTMDDGTMYPGKFGSDNKVNFYPLTGSTGVQFDMDGVGTDEKVPSLTEQLLKDIQG
ncbi:type VI secretion system Vgr family protein [Pseudomonas sp. NPDC090202]|uniref:type VI secretion system Vgr family protein n=1 Tax=unclassified Pseudomonas TaxID=196821 RepID=UPI0038271CBC